MMAEGATLAEQALSSRRFGPIRRRPSQRSTPKQPARRYRLGQIIGLMISLESERSPVVELNRAAAVAMRDGRRPAST
jgi:RNA polymerase sigma-70 factor (ECF subfamily)